MRGKAPTERVGLIPCPGIENVSHDRRDCVATWIQRGVEHAPRADVGPLRPLAEPAVCFCESFSRIESVRQRLVPGEDDMRP